jgi:predicted metal-dependent peptidase
MIGKALSVEQRLTKAVSDIIREPRYRALVNVLMLGDKRVIHEHDPEAARVTTAATDGLNEMYNAAFVSLLSDTELRFLVIHETKHKVYKHLTTWQWMWEEDADLANRSCDHVINLEGVAENKDGFATMPRWTQGHIDMLTPEEKTLLDKEGIKIGDMMGCCDERFVGMNAKQVRDILKQEKQEKQEKQGQGQQGQGQQGQQGEGQQGQGGGPSMDKHLWEDAKAMSEDAKKDLSRQIDTALRQGALSAGKTGAEVSREIIELLEPKVDRRELLRQFFTEHVAGRDYT